MNIQNTQAETQPYQVAHALKTSLSMVLRHGDEEHPIDYATIEVSREECDYEGEPIDGDREYYEFGIDNMGDYGNEIRSVTIRLDRQYLLSIIAMLNGILVEPMKDKRVIRKVA